MEATKLNLPNYNNVLACEAFVQIHFAPAKLLHEHDLERIYIVTHNDQEIFVKLVDLLRVPFHQVSSIMTLPATGMESFEWRKWWRDKHPQVNDETEMAVYYYKRVSG